MIQTSVNKLVARLEFPYVILHHLRKECDISKLPTPEFESLSLVSWSNTAINEVRENLYSLADKLNKIAYVKELLRKFTKSANLYSLATEENDIIKSILNTYCTKDFHLAPKAAQYIAFAESEYLCFFNNIDALLINFELDLIQIQNNIGAIVWNRDDQLLKANGYNYINLENNNSEHRSGTPTVPYFDELFTTLIEKAERSYIPSGNISGTKKIELAAFVELMFEKKWLGEQVQRRKKCLTFAIERYKINLGCALDSGAKTNRENYKKLLKKHFV